MAVNCGTPTPATMRVVQIEPGPIPTFTASAPASISAWRRHRWRRCRRRSAPGWSRARRRTCSSTCRNGRGRCRSPPIDPRFHQERRALEAPSPTVEAAPTSSRPSRPWPRADALRLLHVLDGDEADARSARRRRSAFRSMLVQQRRASSCVTPSRTVTTFVVIRLRRAAGDFRRTACRGW